MKTTLRRLLDYPHSAVFDKSPEATLAFRLSHPSGLTWSVADSLLIVTVTGQPPRSYALASQTVDELLDDLAADGFSVEIIDTGVLSLSADVLLEGSGDQFTENGDHILAFTSDLYILNSGYAAELRTAKAQINEALRQMVIPQAEGEWLDVWGALYNVPRNSGESDAHHAPRIPQEAFRIRVNAFGIEDAIYDATGWRVQITEPWKEIFTLDQSLLSGHHAMYDGERYGYHLIQPVSSDVVNWAVVLPIIERNKAAGVIVLPPEHNSGAVISVSGYSLRSVATTHHARQVIYEDRALLDFSDIEETSIVNHKSRRRLEGGHLSHSIVESQFWGGFDWVSQSWASINYVVSSSHFRDYRVYKSSVVYAETWTHESVWIDESWVDVGPVVRGDFTRRLSTDALLKSDGGYLLKSDGFKLLLG